MTEPAPGAVTRVAATADDLTIARAVEPVVKFTTGEQFFPTDVHAYLAGSSLWAYAPDGRETELVPEGLLDEQTLTQSWEVRQGTVLYVKLVGPLNLGDSASALLSRSRQKRDDESRFRAGVGRLARVGYLSRMLDGLFSVSLLLRGRVPAATAAMAERIYQRAFDRDPRYVYYARVVRDCGWIAIQYWYFYFYNSWRSGFRGVNDHESDWEQVLVYLYEDNMGFLVPEWVAFASHDFTGADLRRRWDDAGELDRVGNHPVVYAGAGSHAAYFRPGEYQADVHPPLPTRLASLAASARRVWYTSLGQASRAQDTWSPMRIPFVDYARGDGIAIGAGQDREWTPVLLEPAPDWAARYRGLWGLYARDPISGENAPAGPMYNRDGSPRGAWYDPLGFAGLDSVPPPPREHDLLTRRRLELDDCQAALATKIRERSDALQRLGAERSALAGSPHLERPLQAMALEVKALRDEVKAMRRERAQNRVLIEGMDLRLARLASGARPDDVRAHIEHLARPVGASDMRFHRLAELWAALSVGLLVLGALGVAVFRTGQPARERFVLIVGMVLLFMLIDSVLRGSYVRTISFVGVALSVTAILILLWNFWLEAFIVGAIAAGLYLLVDNMREVRG